MFTATRPHNLPDTVFPHIRHTDYRIPFRHSLCLFHAFFMPVFVLLVRLNRSFRIGQGNLATQV